MNPYYNNPYGQYYQQSQQEPEQQGSGALKAAGQIAKTMAPMALNAIVPGLGTVAGVGMNMLFPYGGKYPQGGQYGAPVQDPQRQQMMPDLAQFDGPTHEEGGMNLNGAAEIEKKETVDTANKQVYSDTLKVPGTKKTFAKASEKYKIEPGDDEITRRTKKLELERLSKEQDQVKAEKAAKLQAKMDELGLEQGEPVAQPQPGMNPSMMQMPGAQMPMQQPMPQEGMVMRDGGYYTPGEAAANGAQLTSNGTVYGSAPGNYGNGRVQYNNGTMSNIPYATGQGPTTSFTPLGQNMYTPNYINPAGVWNSGQGINLMSDDFPTLDDPILGGDGTDDVITKSDFTPSFDNDYGVDLSQEGGAEEYLRRQAEYGGYEPTVGQTNAVSADTTTTPGDKGGIPWGTMGSLAPVAYNLGMFAQKPEYYEANYNPEYDKSIELMSDRRYNIDPTIQAVRGNLAGTRSKVTNMGGDANKQILGQMGAQMASDREVAKAYAQKENMDNQYMAQEAQFRGQMGAQKAAEDAKTDIYKLQTDAARRAHLGEAAKGVGDFAQINQQMKNQGLRDDQRVEILKQMYGHFPGFAKSLAAVGLG